MLFSIIVPVYKVEKYLRQCVDSVLAQTYTDFELILVDDGSPDECPKICDEYGGQDSRVRVIHKENGGSTSARKAGFEIASGDYIIAVDGDDCVYESMLEKLSLILSEKPYDIVCFGYDTFPKDAKKADITAYREGGYDKEQIVNEIFPTLITGENGLRFPPSIWGKAFKRDIVTPIQNALPDNIVIGEDSCISYASVFSADSLYIAYDKLYRYRVDNESLTRSKKAFSWIEPLQRAEFYLKYMPVDRFGEQVARITAHSLFNVAISVIKAKKYGAAKKEIKEKLSEDGIKQILAAAKFKNNKKEKLALYCLRRKKVFLMKMLSKII